jgi:transcriptional regulator with XRE-family HTH domain
MEINLSTKADNISTRVAQAVKQRRVQLELTLRDLASQSGVSASAISDIERGAKSPTISTLDALARALGLPMSAFADSGAQLASRVHVVRAAERPKFVDTKSGAKRDSFGPTLPGSKVEFLSYAVPPRKVAGPFAAHPSGTIEHMYLAAHHFDNREGKVEALIYLVVEQP